MIGIAESIQSLTSFKRDSAKIVRRLKKTRRAILLTIHGKVELVVQDAASYQRLIDIQEQHESRVAIEQGLEDSRAGRHRPVAQVFAEMRNAGLTEP